MRIAISQINPVIADIKGNTNKIISFINAAKEKNAELIIFPEMVTIGYPPMDLLMNNKLIDDNIKAINRIALESSGIAIICGFVEYNQNNPSMLYNSAAFMTDGRVTSKHYKALLPSYDVFDELRYFSPTKKQEVVKYKDRTIGITICEDILNAEDQDDKINIEKKENPVDPIKENKRYSTDPVKNLVEMNIDLLINISASPYVKGKNSIKWKIIKDISKKNSITTIYVNQVGGNDSLIFDGNSLFVNNKGIIAAKAKAFEEDLLIIEDDKDSCKNIPKEDELEDIRKALTLGIRDYVHKCGFKDVVIGLSGGIDSALTATLAVHALGAGHVMGITMPSIYSSKGSIDDSTKLARNLGIKIEKISISDIFQDYKNLLSNLFIGLPEDVTEENIQARIRGNLLMSYSNKFASLLLTTGNKSELAMGYCTLYGDMAGGLAVISDLPKTLVYKLSNHINRHNEVIPFETIEKPPSAELRENQKDEDSLPSYDILDQILEQYIEKRMSADEIIRNGLPENIVRDILQRVDRNEYKRRQSPPGLKITSKAFGTGRRIPIAQKYIS